MLRFDRTQHTLACGSCGAPLRALKAVPIQPAQTRIAASHQPRPKVFVARRQKPPKHVTKPKRKKRRAGKWLREFAEEAFDFVEDIFD